MTAVSEEMLVAYADGELDEVNRRRVERALAEQPELAARLAAHEQVKQSLQRHYAPLAEGDVPERFKALLQPAAEAEVVNLAQRRTPRKGRPGWASLTAVAASLVLGLMLGRGLAPAGGPVGIEDGQMVARGPLAAALDTQLASASEKDMRIGLSFRARNGQWCRSFEGAALSGVACRAGDHWRLEQALPGARQEAAYRQAASADPRIAATVEALIAGAPVDAASEKAARDSGWK